ncbi:MAG: tetratricopeptide repeat protein, partial [Planctomycetota bacterium]
MARLILVLLLSSLAFAQVAKGRRLLAAALRIQSNPAPGQTEEEALDAAYLKLQEAIQADPGNYQALFYAGFNRCLKISIVRAILDQRLHDMRAGGASEDEQRRIFDFGQQFIRAALDEVYRNFRGMAAAMKKQREWDAEMVTFSRAATKFATREYLKAKGDTPGAIAELNSLIQKRWNPRLCGDLIARCYLQLGAAAFNQTKFSEAQGYWDNGLNWALSPNIRRTLMTNKAGAYEMDNQFGLAEKTLRELIRAESDMPAHWKNLGLVLGYQNHLHAALFAYRRARETSREFGGRYPVALLHGNAWLKSAMIHGKLLESEGDILLSWRLFLEYRAMFGDDYNFCFNFGELCYQLGQYELAWTYLSRAAEIYPFCPNPFQLMVPVAQRMTTGTPEERKLRREKATEDLQRVREAYIPREETPQLKRTCGGLQDRGDSAVSSGRAPLIDPDPLREYSADKPPAWILAIAEQRDPFAPLAVSDEEFLKDPAEKTEAAAKTRPEEEASWVEAYVILGGVVWLIFGGGVVVIAIVALLLVRRRR